MQHSLKKTILAAALALAGAQAGAVTVWTLDSEGLTYTLTGDLATGNFTLDIAGVNTASDQEGGRTFLEDLSFNLPTGYTGATILPSGPSADVGGLDANGCNGQGSFFCFNNLHLAAPAAPGGTMSVDFNISASSFEDYVPHLKVDWVGSKNNYNLVSQSMVAAVPEPETYAMMLAGLGAMGFVARRRQKLQQA